MKTHYDTLVEFEVDRAASGKVPPEQSDSFYNIGDGQIQLYCISNEILHPLNYLFDLSIKTGSMNLGNGSFTISTNAHYNSLKIKENSTFINDGILVIKGQVDIYGTLILKTGSKLIIESNKVISQPNSKIIIEEGAIIDIRTEDIALDIYGRVEVDVSLSDFIYDNDKIYTDSSAVIVVTNIELGDREYSLTDYELFLRNKEINKYTQGDYNFPNGRAGYVWKDGNPSEKSQVIELDIIYGDIIMGDFKLSVLGDQNEIIPNLQITQSIRIRNNSTLYISEAYNGFEYMRPELYLGIIMDNSKTTATCTVEGSIIVDGKNSDIIIDRESTLRIEEGGLIKLQNGGSIKCTNNGDRPVLLINGTLIMNDISQIETFETDNIFIGDKGKVIILNDLEYEHEVLFSTPNGIHSSELYRIFENKINKVEYHIQENTGIRIDQYYDFYAKDMTDWYGGMRIEKAIHDGLIVWHNNGFIELEHDIIPWANLSCSLLQASRIFKTFGSYDGEKLQEAIERLRYAGCGNIVFRYIEGELFKDVTLVMDDINMRSITNSTSSSDEYILDCTTDGELFMKNSISDTSAKNLITEDAKIVHLNEGETQFTIP